MLRLEVIKGEAEPVTLTLGEETLIGRTHGATLRIFDESVSRQHARILTGGLRTLLIDLESANGTLLNGERIKGEAALFDGDEISIGSVRMRFRTTDGSERDTVVPTDEDADIEASVDPESADPAREAAHEHAAQRLRLVCDAALCCAEAQDPDALAGALLERICETFKPDRATFALRGGDGSITVRAAHPKGAEAPNSRTLARRVLQEGEALLVGGGAQPPEVAGLSIVGGRYRSTMAAPLRVGEDVLGMICVESEHASAYARPDLTALATVGRQAALGLRNLNHLFTARAETGRLQRRHSGETAEMMGEHPSLDAVREKIERAAAADAPVLVTGETGTGKELVARHLHTRGARAAAPFVALNCAALVEGLLESELFGHEKGAFTGAVERREGRLMQAGRGTLFLDEVGDLPPALQAKLLRVLSEGTFMRVGGSQQLRMECRIVAATHRDLPARVKQALFREDLYYRLAVVTIEVPALRDRGDDVLLLAESALERLASRLGRRVPRLADDARCLIRAYPWPGNVRELFNILERVLVLLDGEVVTAAELPLELRHGRAAAQPTPTAPSGEVLTLREAEARAVRAALVATAGRKGAAAALLGIAWPTLNRKIREYGITVERDPD